MILTTNDIKFGELYIVENVISSMLYEDFTSYNNTIGHRQFLRWVFPHTFVIEKNSIIVPINYFHSPKISNEMLVFLFGKQMYIAIINNITMNLSLLK